MTVSRETLVEMAGIDVSRETFELLSRFVELVVTGNEAQNLIARDTEMNIWERHIADSLQLIPLAPAARSWLDIGSGAGLPGMVIAIATGAPTVLVDSRRLRTDFLSRVAHALGLANVEIVTANLAAIEQRTFGAITARAVAALDKLFAMARPFANSKTSLIFPKGRSAAEEVATARRTWQGHIEIVPSRTDANAGIVVARDVRWRGK